MPVYILLLWILSIVTFGAYKINTAMGGNPVFSTIYRFAVAGAVIATYCDVYYYTCNVNIKIQE